MVLSIITITYNNLKGLQSTFESVRKFESTNQVEWIVIDGGSKDGTAEFLKETGWAKFISEPDRGIYDAMNKGLRQATGDYIWFLNAGDICNPAWNPEKLLELLQKGHEVYYSETLLMDENLKVLGKRSDLSTRRLPERLTYKSLLKGMVVGHQSFIPKRNICTEFDLQYRHVADYDWMIRTLKTTSDCMLLPEALACFDVSGHSSLHRKDSNLERMKVMNKHFGTWETFMQHLRIIWVNLTRSFQGKKAY